VDIDIQIASRAQGIPSRGDIRKWVSEALKSGHDSLDREIAVRIVDEAEMQVLNRDYRQQDRPTNVLSFPAAAVDGLPASEPAALGDIVVCAGVVASEAAEQGKALADHWGHMLVHGTLHLLGYDHMSAADAAEMEDLERRVLAGLGVADPYGGN
jgi:probable rRNA maturation factor